MNQFEAGILVWIQNNLRAPGLDGIVKVITHLGDAGILWICVTVALLAFKKTRKLGWICAGSMIFTLIVVNGVLKPIVARVRPYNLEAFKNILVPLTTEGDKSFPSGHTANSLSCAWVLFRKDRRRFGIPALVLAVLIALSRLYVGVHYMTDVLAGAAAGIICAEAAIRVVPKWIRKIRRKLKRKKTGNRVRTRTAR